MLASLTVISRASSGLMRTSEAMELRVLKRKWGLIWRCRASRRASRSRRFCSSSFISMRRAFQTLRAMPTTMGALSQTSTCTQRLGGDEREESWGNVRASQTRQASAATMRKSMRNWRSRRDAEVAADPAIEAEVDEGREGPDLVGRDEAAEHAGERGRRLR